MSAITPNGSIEPTAPRSGVVPNEVGWQFVPQYYTFMNKHPDRLHCFYTKQSTYSHGTEGDDVALCHGQGEIHSKITSLNLQDCKVYIHSVDSQASLNGSIVIQVIGEMSNRDEPWRKFVQTFFLAEQPNGYFVLNDIFRFLKEEAVEDDSVSATEEPSAPEHVTQDEAPAPVEPIADEPEPSAPDATSKSPVPEPAIAIPTVSEPEVDPPSAASDWVEVSAPPAVEPAPQTVATPEPRPVTPPPAPATLDAPAASPSPAPPSPSSALNGSSPKPAAEKPAAQPPVQAPAPAKPVPKTWANLAAANSGKWGSTAASAVATSAAPPPAPTPPGVKTPQRSTGPTTQNRSPAYQAASSITTPAVFIKGVVDPLSNDLLKTFLTSEFGPLKDIEVVRSKACAFVEFVNLPDARRALIASLPVPQGGQGGVFYRYEDESIPPTRITIETRKERGERPVSSGPPRGTGRGGFDGGRGGGNLEGRGSFRGRGRGGRGGSSGTK